MSLDERLRTAFKEETEEWTAPAELKEKILNQVVHIQGGRRMKKWVVTCILAASLLIPTGAFAGYSYISDSIYGSQENIAEFGVTQKQYDELEAKLQAVKQNLSEEEFTKLMSLLKELGSYNLKMADADGEFNVEKLSAGEQKNYKKLTTELEPIFNKLKDVQPTKRIAKPLYSAAFWKEQLNQARQILSKEEFNEFQKLINELKAYDEKTLDPDGRVHVERLSKEDQTNIEQVVQQLQPFLKKLGILIKPRT
ncbi:DUF3600 domain-containing protein [Paenibacillus dokdonensis]|uniref:DUF3600 domain-containing protein n=1 Tax=Paenibacillus dokdonensis TaxID=2567944 RepID=A0ABU6GP06_9BACL|nr:DUF3600 domain-containing protein [Paenibacillus dokdonensis]MEC0239996.1 DUF3600 domain-containing protein [Paenibacillus dokdonensis]